jgi:hypothetical protein
MTPNTFEIVTVLTIASIGTIILLYFIVLKKKGWLSDDSNGSYYRCPNPECRKIFDKPVAITDLSGENPIRLHSACPHCGFDLEKASPSLVRKKAEMPSKTLRSSEESVVTVKASNPEMSAESTETSEKPIVTKGVQKLPTAFPKSLQARPPECSHFFGYLRKIPKNTPIPDGCFSCRQMVECLSYNISEETK